VTINYRIIQQNVRRALSEDVGDGDKSAALVSHDKIAHAQLITRESAVIAGIPWFIETFKQIDSTIIIHWHVKDGDLLEPDQILCHIQGPASSILTAERTAINFLQLLSGTATITHEYAQLIKHTQTKLLDTRKTIPGLRYAQKYAVRCGGGSNHRLGLYDAIMLKENHIIAAGSIKNAVIKAQALYPDILLIVEVENNDELKEALNCGVRRILLDNFDLAMMHDAVKFTNGRAQLEVSGGVNKETIANFAQTGVDFISVGKLTKDVRAIDYSLRFL
jgi:nicotinate-nucleotide pyrophosphorylase (carboxylating)